MDVQHQTSHNTQLHKLADYCPSDFLISHVELDIRLNENHAQIFAKLHIKPNNTEASALRMNGDELTLQSACLDGTPLTSDRFLATSQEFILADPPLEPFTLELVTRLSPKANTKLMGLYKSATTYCTQCEAEGFRRITYFLDRPDILSSYRVRIEANRREAPVLLSNGNLVESGHSRQADFHYAVWEDPIPKPCYLFALVAGDLGSIHDHFFTASGRKVALAIYVEHGKENQALYAMDALKRAMTWDEARFGREYDLDVFNIVAVSDFNAGAMENKGLNIFNDKLVLALPQTATDSDYQRIESVIAHEYFHNWTGNRITCRDWFQLCLKEGLTVFRDQEFSADERSRPVKRIEDVRLLRQAQFPEDAGPLAHNVRPESYLEINNFYTATVYDKGAELIRVLKHLIGKEAFDLGLQFYFDECDGTAATVEDFLGCFAKSSGRDLTTFLRWYQQAGTPVVKIDHSFDLENKIFTLILSQYQPKTPGQTFKLPLPIPITFALFDAAGEQISAQILSLAELSQSEIDRQTIEFTSRERKVTFRNIEAQPMISLLRDFSAPVILDLALSEAELAHQALKDTDPFNRWQALQNLATQQLLPSKTPIDPQALIAALYQVLHCAGDDPYFAAQMLALPGLGDIALAVGKNIDPDQLYSRRVQCLTLIGQALIEPLQEVIDRFDSDAAYSPSSQQAGRRALRQEALNLLAFGEPTIGHRIARKWFEMARNMTEEAGALNCLCQTNYGQAQQSLDEFYYRHSNQPLVIDKWFSFQALIPHVTTPETIRKLTQHSAFSYTNPNRIRALLGSFAQYNLVAFHNANGTGYQLLLESIARLDPINPQIAARLLTCLRNWADFEPVRAGMAKQALEKISALPNLSKDVQDIVGRCLATNRSD